MIKAFKHRGLRRFWETGSKAGIPAQLAGRIRVRLSVLHAANEVADMGLPGYGLHPLKGNRKGEWSINLTGNWRIVFRMHTPGEVTDVGLEDYH